MWISASHWGHVEMAGDPAVSEMIGDTRRHSGHSMEDRTREPLGKVRAS